MNKPSKLGTTIALISQLVALTLSLFALLFATSPVQFTVSAWLMTVLTGMAVLCSLAMYAAKTSTAVVLNLVCTIIAGFFTIVLGKYWILLLLLISLIGCIIYRAGKKI